jgi:hypothetical protein
VADLNRDGHLDIVCGGHYYPGPAFTQRHEYTTPLPANKRNPYDGSVYTLEHFFSWTHDFNRDGWMDILVVGLTGRAAVWFENPGRFPDARKQEVIHWKHMSCCRVFLETVVFDDLLGRPASSSAPTGTIGYARPDSTTPQLGPSPVSPLETELCQPTASASATWTETDARTSCARWLVAAALEKGLWVPSIRVCGIGGAEICDDVNGVRTTLSPVHARAGWQFEQRRAELREDRSRNRKKRRGNRFRFNSHNCALALVDMDADGLLDLMTGRPGWRTTQGSGLDQPAVYDSSSFATGSASMCRT